MENDYEVDMGFIGLLVGLVLLVFLMGMFSGGCLRGDVVEYRYRKAAVSRGYAEWDIDDLGHVQFKWKEPAKDE